MLQEYIFLHLGILKRKATDPASMHGQRSVTIHRLHLHRRLRRGRRATDHLEDHLDGADLQENGDSGCNRAPDALIAQENANAEFLIGLDGSPDDDAVGKLAAFRAKLQMAEEFQKRMGTATVRTQQAAAAGVEPEPELNVEEVSGDTCQMHAPIGSRPRPDTPTRGPAPSNTRAAPVQ